MRARKRRQIKPEPDFISLDYTDRDDASKPTIGWLRRPVIDEVAFLRLARAC